MTRRGRGDCAHCHAHGVPVSAFGARLCDRCRYQASTRIGDCPRCTRRRLLPGRLESEFVCAACAGIAVGCERCEREDRPLHNATTCVPCVNRHLLIDGLCEGADPGPEAAELLDAVGMIAPWRLRRWLASNDDLLPVVRDALATGTAVTHEALDELAASHRVEHLRRRLIAAGSLPERHHQLSLFDRWLRAFLPTISDDQHRQAISAYAVWHHRRRLAAQVDAGTMRVSAPRASRRHIRAATRFLEFLAHRQRSLAGCRQVDIDDWLAGGPTTRRSAINFVTWARTGGLCPRHLAVPDYAHRVPDEMPRAERSALIGRLLHDPDIVLRDRVAGLLVAVYAQPVTRVTQLRRRHVLDLDGTTGVCLGVDVVELEDVIATHVGRLAAGVDDPNGWLFPGRTPGQPVSAHLLAERLHALGVTRAARCGALHELVTHVPSPLLAGLLGYNPVVIALRAEALATSWHTYTAVAAERAEEANHTTTPEPETTIARAAEAEAADISAALADTRDALG